MLSKTALADAVRNRAGVQADAVRIRARARADAVRIRARSQSDSLRTHPKAPLIYIATALALTGAGTASAATTAAYTQSAAHHAAAHHGAAYQAAAHQAGVHSTGRVNDADMPWSKVSVIVARQTDPGVRPGHLPLADRLMPLSPSGPQAFMPISSVQMANAATIVRQALDKRMGVRSAVIAVATAMQESTLLNLDYGTADSLGLFQQRPSMGWGTPAQVTDPVYAADAFLDALRRYQAYDSDWASRPLWQAAQGVQNSGFPYAYAKHAHQNKLGFRLRRAYRLWYGERRPGRRGRRRAGGAAVLGIAAAPG